MRSSRLKAAILGALVGLITIPTAALARQPASPPTVGSRCDRRHSSTLLETGKVRIYAMPEEPEGHAEHRNPAISGRPVFACLEGTGRSRLLDLPEVGGEKHAYWVKVDERVFAVNAPLVAYSYSQYYLDTHQTWIRVRSLLTGKVIRTCLVGGAVAPRPGPRVTDIVLGSTGEVGWNAQGEWQPSSEEDEPGCNPTGRRERPRRETGPSFAPLVLVIGSSAGKRPGRGIWLDEADQLQGARLRSVESGTKFGTKLRQRLRSCHGSTS
jgi:hypothetical protein